MKMDRFKRSSLTFLAIVLIVALTLGGLPADQVQAEAAQGLFSDAGNAVPADVRPADPSVARSRYLYVNQAMLFDASGQPLNMNSLPEVTLNIFPDVAFTGVMTGLEVNQWGTSWTGNIKGRDGYFYLVVSEGAFIAHIASPEGVYEISSAGDNLYQAIQIDQSVLVDHDPAATFDPPGDIIPEGDLGPTADSANSIDIMVVYTDDARTAEGTTPAMNARIALAVTETNTSYANAGVTTRLNLVHTKEYSYTESGSLTTDLNRLLDSTDSYFVGVQALRDTYKADMVGLIVENGGAFCGLASSIMANANNAYQVTDRSCATGYYSFGHEFGHLQGARHDVYVDPTASPYTYGHGYVHTGSTTDQRWRTVMAYNTKCQNLGYNCTRLQWWSNPAKTYNSAAMGNTTAKNFLVLNTTDYTVANFRQRAASQTPTPNSPSGNITDRTPTFRWSKITAATNYQFEVRKGTTLVYTKTVTSAACGATTCSNTPTTLLAYAAHNWRVRAKVGGVWKAWSAYKNFTVTAPTVIPTPVAPSGNITDRTPTFRWSKIAGATNYQFEVRKGTALVYTRTVTSTACGATTCSNTPTTSLAYAAHKWRVRAKVGGLWKAWSAYKNFSVQSSAGSFNSTFTSNSAGWTPVNGTWIVGGGTYQTPGVSDSFTSSRRTTNYSIFTYEVRLRRSGCSGCSYGIMFNGSPLPVGLGARWNQGYGFYINDSDQYSIWRYDYGSASGLVTWTTYSPITTDYNTLKVTYNKTSKYVQFFINGVRIAYGYYSSYQSGQVGLTMFNDATLGNRLYVDWATLSLTAPSAMEAGDGILVTDDGAGVNLGVLDDAGFGIVSP